MSRVRRVRFTFRRSITGACVLAFLATLFLNAVPLRDGLVGGKWDTSLLLSLRDEDEARYLARVREVTDGVFLAGNPILKEHREDLPPGGFAEWFVAFPMLFFRLSLAQVVLITDLLFPFLVLTLTFLWVENLLQSPLLSSSFLLLFASSIGTGLLRDVTPKVTLLPASLYLFLLFYPGGLRNHWWILGRGALLGLMFYTYPYHWTLFLVAEALLVLHHAWHSRKIRQTVFDVARVFVPFALAILPYVTLLRLYSDPTALRDAYAHLSLIPTRLPVAPFLQAKIVPWILAVGVLRLIGKLRGDSSLVLLAILGASLVVLNSNLITGFEVEYLGHYGRVIEPFLFLASLLALKVLTGANVQRATAFVLIAISVITLLQASSIVSANALDARERWDDSSELFAWLEKKLPRESVVLAPQELSERIPVVTSHYVFMNRGAHFFSVREEELVDRYLVTTSFFPGDIETTDHGAVIVFGNYPGARFAKARTWHRILELLSLRSEPFTLTQADFIRNQELRSRLDRELFSPDWDSIRETLNRYELDIVVTRDEVPELVADLFAKVATVGGYRVYELR